MENRFLFDYLTMTFKTLTAEEVLDLVCDSFANPDLKVSNFILLDSGVVTGYNRSYRFLGERFFTVNYYEGDSDRVKSICLQLTGKGCQYVTSLDFASLLTFLKKNDIQYNVTRLDVALDDFTGFLPKSKFLEAFEGFAEGRSFVSSQTTRESVSFHSGNFKGKFYRNLYFGSRQSTKMLRIYDKRAEQKLKDVDYWERLELQLRRSSASQFLEHWLESGDFSGTFSDALRSMFRIVDETSSRRSTNRDSRWFVDFLHSLTLLKTHI